MADDGTEVLARFTEVLGRLDERTEKMYDAMFGNGRPGVVQAVAVLQDDMRRREREAADLRKFAAEVKDAAPSARNKALVNSGVLTAVLISVFTALKTVFGF